VQTGLLAVYLGGSANTPINLKAPSGYTASGSATPITLVSVNLQSLLNLLNLGGLISGLTTLVDVLTLGALDLTEISVNINLTPGQLTIPVANQSPTPLVFTYPGTPSSPYTLSAGTDSFVPHGSSALNSGLSVQLTANGGLLKLLGDVTTPILNVVLGPLLSALGSTLVPMLLQPVDSLLTSVTGLLGLSLGNAYVTNTPDSIKCGNPMLVQ
jgi:hypothetical protein